MDQASETPKLIELDASGWKTVLDFHTALRAALGSPEWHGSSLDAFIDSIIYGDMNQVDPPFAIRILHWLDLPREIAAETELFRREIGRPKADVTWEFVL